MWDPRTKPERGTYTLDPEHPLAQGLLTLHLFDEGGGWQSQPVPGMANGLSLASPLGILWGPRGLSPTTQGGGVEAVLPAWARPVDNLTVACRVRYAATPEQNAGLWGVAHNSNDSAPYGSAMLCVDATPRIRMITGKGGSFGQYASTVTVGPGWAGTVVGVVTPSGGNLYVNRVPYPFTASGAVAYGTTARLYAGNYTGVLRNPACEIEWGSFYGRALSPTEVAWLQAEPYAMLRPLARRTYFVPATGATSITGAASGTQAAQTAAAAGTETFAGTSAGNQAANTTAAAGQQTFVGSAAATQGAASADGAGTQRFAGAVASSQPAPGSTAAGTQGFVGSASGSQPAATTAASAQQIFVGLAASTQSAHVHQATDSTGPVTGTAASTQALAFSAAAGQETFRGVSAAAQAPAGTSAAGTETFAGAAAATCATATSAATGTQTFVGAGNVGQSPATSAATALVRFAATSLAAQAAATSAAAALLRFAGGVGSTQSVNVTAVVGVVTAPGGGTPGRRRSPFSAEGTGPIGSRLISTR